MVKSTIYKIFCKDPEITNCYVGRTIDVTTRLRTHKSTCNNEACKGHNYKLYQTIRSNGGFDNWTFEELEIIEHDATDTLPAREREYYWFNELKATLNNNTPNQHHTISCKKWRENNATYIKEKGKIYEEQNREKLKLKSKNYYHNHKEKMLEASKKWISNEENREKNRIYQRERCRKIAEQKRLQKLVTLSEEL